MFKLVVIPEDDGTLYVNTFNSFYAAGGSYDITRYVDFDSYDVERGKILNEINFNFQDPTTILNKVFKENTRVAYGDSELKLTDEQDANGNEIGTPLDGDTLEFELPFEQVVYDRLVDQFDNVQTNTMYGAIIDDNLSPVNPKMHLHYTILQASGSKPTKFIEDDGNQLQLSAAVNLPSHTIGFDSSNFSTVFDSEFSNWSGAKINNTLYTNYHQAYIDSIFNIKKRSFKYKVKNLPLRILLDLRLNDLLKIKETYYRIDSFTSELTKGEVGLNLVNSFTDTINLFEATPNTFNITDAAQQVSSYITTSNAYIYNKVDLGFGVDWVTITTNGNNMYFDVDLSLESLPRILNVELTNTTTGQTETININQERSEVVNYDFSKLINSQYIPLL